MKLPPELFSQAMHLATLTGQDRAAYRRELEALYGVTASTMSRWLKRAGGPVRTRRGQEKRDLAELFTAVQHIQYSSSKLQQGPIMPAKDAIEIAEHNGMVPVGAVKADAYRAWLRENGQSRADLRERGLLDRDVKDREVQLRTLGPNHVHQVDFSLAINWKIRAGQAVYDELVYRNKLPEAGTPRLLRLMVVDHTTGMFFPWYTVAAGEGLAQLIEGLWHAWAEKRVKGEPITRKYPFRGVPRALMCDRGPGVASAIFKNFLDALQVELVICQSPRAKGSVESAHWWWEQRFESRFRLEPFVSIERLNEEALGLAAHICATETHTRLGGSRRAFFEFHLNRRFESQLRTINCALSVLKQIATAPWKACRVNGAGIVQFRGECYRVPEEILPQKTVEVTYSPFEFPQVVMRAAGAAETFLQKAMTRDEFGFHEDAVTFGTYRSPKDTARDTSVKVAKRAVSELAGQVVTRGYHLDQVEASGIRSAETPVETPAAAERTYTREQAREMLREARGGQPWTAAERAWLAERFGDRVTEADIDAARGELERGIAAKVIAFRAAEQ